MTDAYQSCLDFLFGRLNYERVGMPRNPGELRLGRVRRLLRRLGDPQDALTIVHVGGTKGKGSTSAMLAAALGASGRRVGLFCSPHLQRLEERFVVDGREATADELVDLTERVRPIVERLDGGDTRHDDRGLTFFDVTTAMGLLHFAQRGCDAVVLEVGLGGRLDSTNAVRPAVSVITSISLDHTKQLGHTLAAIATEKAGIIKHRTPVVSGVTDESAREVIRRTAAQRQCPGFEIDRDFRFHLHSLPISADSVTRHAVMVQTWRTSWGEVPLPLLGPHQAANAAVALAALDVLAERTALSVSRDDVVGGFSQLRFPARVEVLGRRPFLVVDGAHNVASSEALTETLRTCFPPSSRTLIFGTTREKDAVGQLRPLLPLFDRVIVTRYIENPRSVPPEELQRLVGEINGVHAELCPNPAEALTLARAVTDPDGLICVTGSLFLAAETRAKILDSASAISS
jgi:dihydrofolate synthase/folylpolyglutamate synthase